MKEKDEIEYFEQLNPDFLDTIFSEDEEDIVFLEEDSENDDESEISDNIPLNGSPLYPRIFIGESAKPLMNTFHDSEYVDDNISRTYLGLLSFYG